ncbi:hypothetical protein [Planococcus lenghuensis]|uniref:ZIP Zinc transporter n=1 Tax=Planococcus lenghuensis TaxID=2213202 RepID=A0A1Q2L091_9BACL|nr:hypothetical protein [Planococcus lenghuensis]AQQ53477.1 hypothetical protein B0X71_10595 [Planococcus lenghuensis]
MTTTHWLTLAFTIGFIIIHFSSKFLKLSASNPRSPILSFAGGATIAYTFIYLIPELSHYLQVLKEVISSGSWLTFFEDYTYFLALIGLLIYHGLDTVTKSQHQSSDSEPSFGFFMVHVSSFFFYNMTIGYLLVTEQFSNYWAMTVYFLALAFHFMATDHTLQELHEEDYDKYGRWFLVAAVFSGWLIGVIFQLPEYVAAIAISFLAGGLLLNTFKEEIHESKSSNFWAFTAGALLISLLHMVVH